MCAKTEGIKVDDKVISIEYRTMDTLGRFSIPIKLRRRWGIKHRDEVKVMCYADRVEIRPVGAEADGKR